MDKEKYNIILDTFMPSEQMREYLKTVELSEYEIDDLICGAPASLETKAKFAFGESKTDIDRALHELNNVKKDELLYLTRAWYDFDVYGEKQSPEKPFANRENLVSYLRAEAEECEGYDEYSWEIVEKWKLDGGEYRQLYTYYFIFDEVIFFHEEGEKDFKYSYGSRDLNLPVPYENGDALIVDCTPFAPPITVTVTEKINNYDCCGVQISYTDPFSKEQRTKSLKHGLILDGVECPYVPMLSPLYRISAYKKSD